MAEFLTNEDLRFEDMLRGIEDSRKRIDTEREETEILKRESERIKEEIAVEKEKFIQDKNEIINKTKEEARVILNKARIASDKLLTEIRKAANVKEAEKAAQEFRKFCDDTDEEFYKSYQRKIDNTRPPEAVREGETVRIVSLNNKATVLKAPDKDGQVYVQAGIMKLYVPLSDLRLEADVAPQKNKKNVDSSPGIVKALNIKSELDVRGMTVDEAVIIIDRHIHDGFIAKQSQFSIIHGKGTGALRTGIHNYLKTCKQIKSFRLGTFGEGDAGVTIVTIR